MIPGSGPSILLHLYFNADTESEFFGSLFRWVKPVLWKRAKAFGRETLRTGGEIFSDIAENRSAEVSGGDIVSRHVTESTKFNQQVG